MELNYQKALVTGDLHLSFKFLNLNNNKYTAVQLEKIKQTLVKNNIGNLFILGDTFHNKDKVSATLSKVFKEFLIELNNINVKVVIIVGNHDYSNFDYQFHALQQYEGMEGITIVSDSLQWSDDIAFVAFRNKKDELMPLINRHVNAKCLLGHFDINGFLPGDTYVEIGEMMEKEDFKLFKLVLSGHYHTPQSYVKSGINIHYAGSPITTDHKEDFVPKRFIILDLDTLEFQSIDSEMNFHETIHILAKDIEILPEIDKNKILEGFQYRIILEGTKEEIALVEIPKKYPAKITRKTIKTKKKKIKLNSLKDQENLIERYIEYELNNDYKDMDLDAKSLEKTMRTYINAVRKK